MTEEKLGKITVELDYSEDGNGTSYTIFEDGQIRGSAEQEEDNNIYAEFKNVPFVALHKVALIRAIRKYFGKRFILETSTQELEQILGKGDTLDFSNRTELKGREITKISVKYGTDSQVLITEWM